MESLQRTLTHATAALAYVHLRESLPVTRSHQEGSLNFILFLFWQRDEIRFPNHPVALANTPTTTPTPSAPYARYSLLRNKATDLGAQWSSLVDGQHGLRLLCWA